MLPSCAGRAYPSDTPDGHVVVAGLKAVQYLRIFFQVLAKLRRARIFAGIVSRESLEKCCNLCRSGLGSRIFFICTKG